MDKPISVGDLVVVVRWPCCGYRLGQHFKVEKIMTGLQFKCNSCGKVGHTGLTVAWDGASGPRGAAGQLSWLKRIPPLDELESEKRNEEITA